MNLLGLRIDAQKKGQRRKTDLMRHGERAGYHGDDGARSRPHLVRRASLLPVPYRQSSFVSGDLSLVGGRAMVPGLQISVFVELGDTWS